MRISVLGAGNGGQAFAGGQTLKGNEVHLAAVPDHAEQITVIQTFGGVMVEGVSASGQQGGFARIATVDTDVVAAIESGEVIFIVVPAFAREPYLRLVAESPAGRPRGHGARQVRILAARRADAAGGPGCG